MILLLLTGKLSYKFNDLYQMWVEIEVQVGLAKCANVVEYVLDSEYSVQ